MGEDGSVTETYTDNEDGEYVKVTFAGSVSPLNDLNSAKYVVRYKKTTESEWEKSMPYIGLGYEGSGEAYFEADPDASYDVQLEVIDDFPDKSAKRTVPVSTAFTLMDWHYSGTGMGFGKVAEKENTAQFALHAEFLGAVYGKAFGLGTLPAIPDGSDINDCTDIGGFAVRSIASAETMKNLPRKTAGRLYVTAPVGLEDGGIYSYREQVFLPHTLSYGEPGWTRLVSKQGTTEWHYGAWNSTALASYPVNSIYISYSHTSPATLFGGTWERISNAFLWGCDANGGIGTTGGEKTHTLTADEMPKHNHGATYTGSGSATKTHAWLASGGSGMAYQAIETGGGAAHNNMPPYVQVSIWRRTA